MARDPAHPWVGEAVPLDYANVIAGAPFDDFGDSIRYRVRDDGSSTLTAGDSFIAGFYESDVMLSGDDVVASFAVVCSGSGTLRLSGGTDPDWALDDPADATVPMGTHVVSGDTVVVGDPFPSFDVDAYLAQIAETIVYVECLSGTVEINQVKLRLWPPGGPTGNWVDAPGFDTTAATSLARASNAVRLGMDVPIVGGDPGALFDAAAAELTSEAQDPANMVGVPSTTTGAIEAQVEAVVGVSGRAGSPGLYGAASTGDLSGTIVQQPDPVNVTRLNTPNVTGVYGLDYSWPPDEVPGDVGVDLLGTPTATWGAHTLTTAAEVALDDGSGGAATLHVTVVPDDAFSDPSLLTFPVDPGVSIPAVLGTMALPLPDANTVLVSLTHPSLSSAPAYGGGGDWGVGSNVDVQAPKVDSTVTIPPHRYWSPTAPATIRRVLRQLHRDDGQGVAPPRAFGGASRIRTSRAYGYD